MKIINYFPRNNLILIDIFYYLPDYPLLIQEFIYQTEDSVPKLCRTYDFLKYWNDHIEAKIKEVILSGLGPDGQFHKFEIIDDIFKI